MLCPVGGSYLIVTSGRTGSSILAHALQRTGLHGNPDEHLTVTEIDGWAVRLGVRSPLRGGSMVAYLDALRTRTSSSGGGFGTKLHTAAIPMVARFLAEEPGAPDGDAAVLLGWAFPDTSVIWSRRRDRVAVAISMWRAETTGAWARPSGTTDAEPVLDPSNEQISELHRLLHLTDLSIPGVLARAGLPVHEVVYEDLVEDWDGTIVAVRRFLGEEGSISPPPPPTLARQAGAGTEAAIDRWVAATDGCAACDHPGSMSSSLVKDETCIRYSSS
jgi:trehalose 2-sulfotransferase